MVKDIWEENPLLFHYTTAGGLQGILSSQSIRATHDMHMNDSLEMALLHKRLADHFAPYFKVPLVEAAKNNNQVSEKVKALGEINAMAVVEAKRLCEGLQKGTFKLEGHPDYFEPFIISFCGHQKEYERQHGLLSQWRAYGRAGYVIAFETRKMVEFVKADTDVYAYNGCQVGDVVYDGDDGRFNSEFAELLSAIPQVVSKWFYHEPPNFAPIYDPWLRSVSRFKHRGFGEEGEVRAVMPRISQYWADHLSDNDPKQYEKIAGRRIKEVAFRDEMVPYITLSSAIGGPLPIEYIIVGPDARKDLRADKLKKFLELSKLDIEVKISETPLV